MLDSIRLLRGLAALMVIVYHSCEYMRTHGNPAMGNTFQIGAIGVDMFFAVSGFVMLSALDARGGQAVGARAAVDFMARRTIRIAPIYWVGTSILYGIYVAVPTLFKSFSATFEQYWRSMFFLPSLDGVSTVHPLLNQGWTLYHEMYFYLVLSLLICCGIARAGVLAAMAVCVVSTALSMALPGNRLPWVELVSAPINIEFSFGAIVYIAYRANLPSFVYWMAAFTAIAAGGVFYGDYSHDVGWGRVSSWGVASAGVLLLLVMLEKFVSRWLGWMCLYAGDPSYSLYIFHGLVFSGVDIFLKKSSWRDVPTFTLICLCTGAVLASNAIFLLVERPLTINLVNAWKRSFGNRHQEILPVSS